jgi:hypothetical protein
MLSLYNSESFQNDLNRFQTDIQNMDDEEIKNNCKNLLNKLISQVKSFDKDHERMIFARDISDQASRDEMVNVRKVLEKKIKEYKQIKKLKY